MSELDSKKSEVKKVHRRSFFAALGSFILGAFALNKAKPEGQPEIHVTLHQEAVKREKRNV